MKRFEVGKMYLVRPYSYTSDGVKDYRYPEIITVRKRTDTHILCEVKSGLEVTKKTFRILKISNDLGMETIKCSKKYVGANKEIK